MRFLLELDWLKYKQAQYISITTEMHEPNQIADFAIRYLPNKHSPVINIGDIRDSTKLSKALASILDHFNSFYASFTSSKFFMRYSKLFEYWIISATGRIYVFGSRLTPCNSNNKFSILSLQLWLEPDMKNSVENISIYLECKIQMGFSGSFESTLLGLKQKHLSQNNAKLRLANGIKINWN